jgi:hypothetical protein
MLMIPNVKDENWMPDPEHVAAMTRYNEQLTKAGVLLSLDGLHPPSKGTRVSFSKGRATTAEGPFSGAVVGGYWTIQVNSKQEAVDWAKKCPAADGDMIEVRQVAEMSDFPPEVQKAAKL